MLYMGWPDSGFTVREDIVPQCAFCKQEPREGESGQAEYLCSQIDGEGVVSWVFCCPSHASHWWTGSDVVSPVFRLSQYPPQGTLEMVAVACHEAGKTPESRRASQKMFRVMENAQTVILGNEERDGLLALLSDPPEPTAHLAAAAERYKESIRNGSLVIGDAGDWDVTGG